MRTFALASGSSGNCYYVESNSGVKVLVDLGLSFTKTKELLEQRDVDIAEISAIFITHEHSDHIAGLQTFIKQLDIPFYMSKGTYDMVVDFQQVSFVKHHEKLTIEDLHIFVLEKPHDAKEAVHFVFDDGKKVGVFTDFGHVTDELKHVMKTVDILYFETNYCEDKIEKVRKNYNINYIHRLTSNTGHLSLQQATEALVDASHSDQVVILSHISENTNSYERSYGYVKKALQDIGKFPRIVVSFQGEPTPWFD